MSLLVFENIFKEYRDKVVLNGVSLRVERGERVALVGPNGTGKTTLLKIALGLEACDRGNVYTARNIKVGHLSQDLKDIDSAELQNNAVLHYEKVYHLECKLRNLEQKMAEQISSPNSDQYQKLMQDYSRLLLNYEAMDGYTIETKIKKVLLGLGLRQETLTTPLDKLSGGEKMRVSVARILLEEPDLLILDEPTNHLDIVATEWFEGFLKKFTGGILFVSHDRYFLDRVATRVAELEDGSLSVRSGNYSNFLHHKQQLSQFVYNEQKRLRWTLKVANETMQGLKSRGKASASHSRAKAIQKLKDETKYKLNTVRHQDHLGRAEGPKIKFKKIRHVSKDIAWADNLRKSFGDVTLFAGACFHIRGGERVGIIGPNGCGKSTLINMLLGKDPNYEGLLRLGEWVKYSYMGQEVLFEHEGMTLLQLISAKRDVQENEARDYLARFQFYGDEVNKSISVLSGGERVRLYLACVMLEDADCLILDEPTNHLDVPAREAVEAALREYKGTIIAVTHDRFFLTNCVGKILEIAEGKITTYAGNYEFYKQLKYGSEEENKQEKADRKNGSSVKRPLAYQAKRENKGCPEKLREQLEARIFGLEERLKSMAALFDQTTPREKYQEYDDLQKEVNKLYDQWNEL